MSLIQGLSLSKQAIKDVVRFFPPKVIEAKYGDANFYMKELGIIELDFDEYSFGAEISNYKVFMNRRSKKDPRALYLPLVLCKIIKTRDKAPVYKMVPVKNISPDKLEYIQETICHMYQQRKNAAYYYEKIS